MADTTDSPAVTAPEPVDSSKTESSTPATNTPATETEGGDSKNESHSERKRKRFGDENGLKFGSRGGKRRDMGRKEWQ